jgi:hypothetical protein
MAICEQFQLEQGTVELPKKLEMFMPPRGENQSVGVIVPKPRKSRPTLKFVRGPKYFKTKFNEEKSKVK